MQGIFKSNSIGDPPAYILCVKCMYPVRFEPNVACTVGVAVCRVEGPLAPE